MIIKTRRFGEIEVSEEKTIYFEKGLPGLDELHKFIFLTPKNMFPFFFLQSIDDVNICLPVVNPFDIIKDYNPSVEESDLKKLGVNHTEDLLL
jgi:flagellar assembly factor FliW